MWLRHQSWTKLDTYTAIHRSVGIIRVRHGNDDTHPYQCGNKTYE